MLSAVGFRGNRRQAVVFLRLWQAPLKLSSPDISLRAQGFARRSLGLE